MTSDDDRGRDRQRGKPKGERKPKQERQASRLSEPKGGRLTLARTCSGGAVRC